MVFEIAAITIDPARAAEFEAAVASAAPAFKAAEGCGGMSLERVVDDPAQYRLVVQWAKVEDHMVTFRGSAGFQTWRDLAGPFFVEPPFVIHTEQVARHF